MVTPRPRLGYASVTPWLRLGYALVTRLHAGCRNRVIVLQGSRVRVGVPLDRTRVAPLASTVPWAYVRPPSPRPCREAYVRAVKPPRQYGAVRPTCVRCSKIATYVRAVKQPQSGRPRRRPRQPSLERRGCWCVPCDAQVHDGEHARAAAGDRGGRHPLPCNGRPKWRGQCNETEQRRK